ncbi:MAG: hypothetical protein ABL958_17790 [Bdellovibrionia bacterium]
MKTAATITIAVCTILTLVSFEGNSEETASWTESMKEMSNGLLVLMPSLVRLREIETESERAEILLKSKALAKSAHKLDKIKSPPSADPALKFISGDLHGDLASAIQLMEQGKWAQGKRQMLGATRNCIACHSLRPGPSRLSFKVDLSGLKPLQQADYYAATRQFEQAIINYEKALTDEKWAAANEEKWNQAFQRLLALTVRVRNSPSLSMELISRFFDSKTYPQGLKPVAWTWRAHTKEWRIEKSVKGDLLKKASELIAKADELQAKTQDPVGLILYLRASGMLHTFLISSGNSQNQEALYLAGKSAEGLLHLNFWTYPEDYYRACTAIDRATSWKKACEERLQIVKNISG